MAAITLPSSLAWLGSDAPAKPDPSQAVPRYVLQHTLPLNVGTGFSYGTGYGDRWAQSRAYKGAVALGIRPYQNACRAARFNVLEHGPRGFGKSAGIGHYSRDEEYGPADPDHPLCKILANPNGRRGGWSMARECAYLATQFMLTGDAPAWCVPNGAGKPVQFYALTSATVQYESGPGISEYYPKGAYRVMPYAAGGSFGLNGGLYAGARLPAEEVHRLIDEHPLSRSFGMSRLEVGDRWIDILDAISRSRWAFFDKGAQLGLMIVIPGAGEEVVQTLNKSITAKHGGADNAGNRIVVMGGGGVEAKVGIHPLNMTSEEMGFIQSNEQALEMVLALLGVPKAVASMGENAAYSNNYAAKQLFYDNSLNPFFLALSDFLTTALAEPWCEFPGQFKIEVEPPPVGDVEMNRKELEYASANGYITRNAYLKATGRPADTDGEVPQSIYLAKLQAQLQQQFAPPPAPGAPGAADPLTKLLGGDEPTAGAPPRPANPDAKGSRPPTATKALPQPAHAEGQKFQSGDKWFVIKDGKAVRAAASGAEGAPGQRRTGQPDAGGAPEHGPEATEQRATVAAIGAKIKDGKEITSAEKEQLAEGLKHLTPTERRAFAEVTGGTDAGAPPAELVAVATKLLGKLNLPPALEAEYAGHIAEALHRTSPGARTAIVEALTYGGRVVMHADLAGVKSAWTMGGGKIAKGDELAGFVTHNPRTFGGIEYHADGAGAGHAAVGIHAHEMGHVIDVAHGRDTGARLTADPKWQSAWNAEIKNGQGEKKLTAYARESAAEGFAELHRHVVERGADDARKRWPRSVKFLESKGLL